MGIVVDNTDYKYGNSGGRGPSIIIPNEIIDTNEFQNLYYNNQDITGTVKFPNLTKIGFNGLSNAFYGCTGLTNVEFPNLKSISTFGLNSAFYNCTGLTNVEFPNLKSVSTLGLNSAFYNCTGLTNVSFPSLTSVENDGLNNTFWYSRNITEIHFRADAKSVIEAQTSYDSKFGATNATIYFDL